MAELDPLCPELGGGIVECPGGLCGGKDEDAPDDVMECELPPF
jgi:hypothetical protein